MINSAGNTGISLTDNAGVSSGLGIAESYPDVVHGLAKPPNNNIQSFGPLLGNASEFVAPRGLTFGDAGRNFLNNPNRLNFDMSLLKHFKITEGSDLQFRAEIFNIFNHTEFRVYDPDNPGSSGNNIVSCYAGPQYSAGFQATGTADCVTGESFLHPLDAHRPPNHTVWFEVLLLKLNMFMKPATTDLALSRTTRQPFTVFPFRRGVKSGLLFLWASLIVWSGCGGSSPSGNQLQASGQLAGNWQFTMASPSDGSFQGNPSSPCATPTTSPVCSGGFLLTDNNGAVTGQITYAILLPGQNGGAPTLCNSGSAPVTGTVSDQDVTLTAVEGNQTFTLTGVLSGNTMMGTYASTDGKGCGTAQTGLQWSAVSVPPLSGTIRGSFTVFRTRRSRIRCFR